MLAELALRLITPAGRMTRRLGLVGESVALWSRGWRQRKAWAPHHERCRAVVAGVVGELARHRTVLVLGSGLLRDLPLDLLCARFERVVLVDAVHLPQIRLRMAFRRKVALVTRDLTGLMAWLAGEREGRDDPLADLTADPAIDLVISANLLSQLAWPVEDWLEENPDQAARLPADLPARCVAWHLADLARFSSRVVLLSDTAMVERDRAGEVTDRFDLMRGVALAEADEGWDWTVAPFGEAERDRETVHRVGAWRDYPPPPQG
jgi:ethanolamine utilization microcompartment shell protein EutS